MKPIRWGIVSSGNIASRFASDFRFVKSGTLTAISSRNLTAAEAFAKIHKIPQVFGSYEEMLAKSDVDVVYIASPHTSHHGQTVAALNTGKAVLCEKPLAESLDHTHKMVNTARANGVYLMEAMWTYFLPAILKAQEWVQEGRIGKIKHIVADFGFLAPFVPESRLFNKALGGGALLDIGIYPIAFTWLFMQRDPLSVKVVSRTASSGVDDHVISLFDFGDSTATLAFSFRCQLQNQAVINGDAGRIVIPEFWQARECKLFNADGLVDHFRDKSQSVGLACETEAVSRDLQNNRLESDIVPLAYSLKFQEHMEMIRQYF